MQAEAKAEVATYYDILNELDKLSDKHPTVSKNFLASAILKRYKETVEWFREMQDHHRQTIEDSIKGKNE